MIYITQSVYIKQILQQLGMTNYRPIKSPMEQRQHLSPAPVGHQATSEDRAAYQSLIGVLQWLSTMTRPDITFTVSNLSRYTNNSTIQHLQAAKHVLKYLSGTTELGLHFGPGQNDSLIGYTDASYCNDTETSRSTGVYCYQLWGGPVSWSSKLQKLIATSSYESEYIAAAEAAKEAIFLGSLI